MAKLRLSPDLTVPEDFATEGVVVIGVRGSGKSNTEVVWCEQLHDAGIPFVAIDPKGDWYGMRLEGTRPGLPIPVFGGYHGDGPLAPEMGVQLADLLADHNMSAILDVSKLTHAGRARFLVDFFERLMERHQAEPHVRNVVLEEAHRYIPQQVPAAMTRVKEAAAAILLEGRSFGLGCWACTQRPARLHNDVLEEVDSAIIHRIGVTATADLKRVRDWVKHEDLGPEISPSLTKLGAGEAWVLSPVALGIVARVQFNRRGTFDSGATPTTQAVSKRKLSTMADIDMDAITVALQESIEKAKDNDPAELRRRISELEKQLAAVPPPAPPVEVPVEIVAVPEGLGSTYLEAKAALDHELRILHEDIESLAVTVAELRSLDQFAEVDALIEGVQERPGGSMRNPMSAQAPPAPVDRGRPPRSPESAPARTSPTRVSGAGMKQNARTRIMLVLAKHGPRTPGQVCLQAGISARSSTLSAELSKLRKAGYVEPGQPITITEAGIESLGGEAPAPLPTGWDLIDFWRGELKGGANLRIFNALVEAWPDEMTKDGLCEDAEISTDSSTLSASLSRLRKLGLVEKRAMRAADELMEGI